MKKENSDPLDYSSNDELFPTEITFPGGLKIRLGCSEDGQSYLKVEPA